MIKTHQAPSVSAFDSFLLHSVQLSPSDNMDYIIIFARSVFFILPKLVKDYVSVGYLTEVVQRFLVERLFAPEGLEGSEPLDRMVRQGVAWHLAGILSAVLTPLLAEWGW